MLRAAAYSRVSTFKQSTGFSFGVQSKSVDAYAEELGATIVFRPEPEVGSGADWDLKGIQEILTKARAHEIDIVICPDPDRLARSLAKQIIIEQELASCGVKLHFVSLPPADSPEAQLLRNIRAVIAEYERTKIMLRTASARAEKASLGLVVGNGTPPFGLRHVRRADPRRPGHERVVGLEPDPETFPHLEEMFRLGLTLSDQALADQLNARGIRSRSGKPWRTSGINSVLTNRIYLGEYRYGESLTELPAVISPELFERVARARRERYNTRQKRKGTGEDPFILRGLLKCGHCGGQIATAPRQVRGRRYRYYMCQRSLPAFAKRLGREVCSLPQLVAPTLEAHVWDSIAGLLLEPDHLRQVLDHAREQREALNGSFREQRERLGKEVVQLRRRLKLAGQDRYDAEEGSAEWQAAREIEAEAAAGIRAVEDRLAQLQPVEDGLDDEATEQLRAWAETLGPLLATASDDLKQRTLQSLQLRGRVVCDPENGLALSRTGRFRIEWDGLLPFVSDNQSVQTRRLMLTTTGRGTELLGLS